MIVRRDFQQMSPEHWEAKKGIPSGSNASRIITSVGKRCVLPCGHSDQCREVIGRGCTRVVIEVTRGKEKQKPCVLHDGHLDRCFAKLPQKEFRCPKMIPQLSEAADAYIAELLSEEVMQLPNYFTTQGHPIRRPFSNEHTENGMELEHEARLAFEMDSGMKVEQVGWCLADDGTAGFSPDGLVIGHKAGLELKCPALHTQFQYLMKGTLPNEYKAQVHWALSVSEYDYWWFYSYAVGADPLLLRVEPDEYTAALTKARKEFWERYQAAKVKLLGAA